MKRNLMFLAASMAALGAGVAGAQTTSSYPGYGYDNGNDYSRTVRCESIEQRDAYCRIERGSDVRIVRQLSNQACTQGRNWDYNDSQIRVSGGCRAEFLVTRDDDRYGDRDRDRDDRYGDGRYNDGRYANNGGQMIHCASRNRTRGRTHCGVPNQRYTLVGRSANCVEGRTWGRDQRGLWVSGKCSANFSMATRRDWRDDRRGDQAQNLRCESTGNGRTYCGDGSGRYTLTDTRNAYCVEGRTWGTDQRGLWVSGNCRAVFTRTSYRDDPRNDMHPSDAYGNNNEPYYQRD